MHIIKTQSITLLAVDEGVGVEGTWKLVGTWIFEVGYVTKRLFYYFSDDVQKLKTTLFKMQTIISRRPPRTEYPPRVASTPYPLWTISIPMTPFDRTFGTEHFIFLTELPTHYIHNTHPTSNIFDFPTIPFDAYKEWSLLTHSKTAISLWAKVGILLSE